MSVYNKTLQWFNERISLPWNMMRWFRLVLGFYLAYESVVSRELMLGFFSVFFLYQAISAASCCGISAYTFKEKGSKDGDDVPMIEYEEVMTKPISKNSV